MRAKAHSIGRGCCARHAGQLIVPSAPEGKWCQSDLPSQSPIMLRVRWQAARRASSCHAPGPSQGCSGLCAGASGWETRETQRLAERRSNGKSASRMFFRKLTIAPYLLREHQMPEASSNLAEAIETSAKMVVLPALAHLVSAQGRSILASVYEITDYSEGNCKADVKSSCVRLAVKMPRRWEPQLRPNPRGGDCKPKAWMPRGASWLFTSELIFGGDWQNWKWQICQGGALNSPGAGSPKATRTRFCASRLPVVGHVHLQCEILFSMAGESDQSSKLGGPDWRWESSILHSYCYCAES